MMLNDLLALTRLVITDLTRMREGRVCIAGYNRQWECIRPVLPPPGINESSLYSQEQAMIFPFAVVQLNFTHHIPHPPHTEDRLYNPDITQFEYRVNDERKQNILDHSIFESVAEIFNAPILTGPGFYIMDGAGDRSLGTIEPNAIVGVVYGQGEENRWKYRLSFEDGSGASYWLTVTDLTWRYYCDWRRDQNIPPHQIASELFATLQAGRTYLRIGLARGWQNYPERCYLQITGVYTFPDYLDGRIFTDFIND